jgi:hypothetical protein
MVAGSLQTAPAHPSWVQANLKWLIPFIVGILVFIAALFALLFGMFRGSDAFKNAVARAQSNQAIIHELGEPITVGWLVTGSININGPSGSADFSVPLRGSTGRGTLYVSATKRAGLWEYSILEVAIEGRPDRVKLLDDPHGV